MTNPTSNFNWIMPEPTNLVTDLPADFEVFGQAVDTDLADLLGGTTGQVLSKTSATDLDFTWVTAEIGDITGVTASSPITGGGTSGDISIGIQDASTSQKGAVQLSDSTSTTSSVLASTPTAVKSAYDLADSAIPKSTVTTAGDVIYATGSGALTRLGIGTENQILSVTSGVPAWATAATSSSGLTLISKTSWTAAASHTVDSVFTSTYDNYRIVIDNWVGSSYSVIPQMQLRYGASTSGSVIYGCSFGMGYTGGSLTTQLTSAAAALDFWRYTGDGSGTFITLDIERVGGSAQKSILTGIGATDAGIEQYKFAGIWTDIQAYTGFVLKTSSGTSTGTVSVYGYAKV
jgi:hypothetical protein